MGVGYKGSQGQTERTVELQEEVEVGFSSKSFNAHHINHNVSSATLSSGKQTR
jgi:hypothetical protein